MRSYHRGVGIEVAQFPSVGGDAARDLEQAVAVVGDGADGRRSGGVATQCAVVDEPGDHARGLALGRLGGTEPRHANLVSIVAVAAQPAGDGGVLDMHATVGQPAPQFRGGAARVRERKEFVGVPVESGAAETAGSAGAGLAFRRAASGRRRRRESGSSLAVLRRSWWPLKYGCRMHLADPSTRRRIPQNFLFIRMLSYIQQVPGSRR